MTFVFSRPVFLIVFFIATIVPSEANWMQVFEGTRHIYGWVTVAESIKTRSLSIEASLNFSTKGTIPIQRLLVDIGPGNQLVETMTGNDRMFSYKHLA